MARVAITQISRRKHWHWHLINISSRCKIRSTLILWKLLNTRFNKPSFFFAWIPYWLKCQSDYDEKYFWRPTNTFLWQCANLIVQTLFTRSRLLIEGRLYRLFQENSLRNDTIYLKFFAFAPYLLGYYHLSCRSACFCDLKEELQNSNVKKD